MEAAESDCKRQKVEIPEGMSKNAWKKLQKQKKWEEQKEEYRLHRKEKKQAAKQRKLENKANGVQEAKHYHDMAKKHIPKSQTETGVKVIMDCDFDELMNDKEIVSMSNQITRCYSAKRHALFNVELVISSFNKRLKERFEKSVPDYLNWKGMDFRDNELLTDILPTDKLELSKYVYLTADTDTELESLDEGHTYIIGGIVDKNRYKRLCVEKAHKLGLRVGRLPIGKYIQMNSRHVLATSHVYELMCMWYEKDKNWEEAFNHVLPPRKLKTAEALRNGKRSVEVASPDDEVVAVKAPETELKNENI